MQRSTVAQWPVVDWTVGVGSSSATPGWREYIYPKAPPCSWCPPAHNSISHRSHPSHHHSRAPLHRLSYTSDVHPPPAGDPFIGTPPATAPDHLLARLRARPRKSTHPRVTTQTHSPPVDHSFPPLPSPLSSSFYPHRDPLPASPPCPASLSPPRPRVASLLPRSSRRTARPLPLPSAHPRVCPRSRPCRASCPCSSA